MSIISTCGLTQFGVGGLGLFKLDIFQARMRSWRETDAFTVETLLLGILGRLGCDGLPHAKGKHIAEVLPAPGTSK